MLPHLRGNRFAHQVADPSTQNPFAKPVSQPTNGYDNMSPYNTGTQPGYSQQQEYNANTQPQFSQPTKTFAKEASNPFAEQSKPNMYPTQTTNPNAGYTGGYQQTPQQQYPTPTPQQTTQQTSKKGKNNKVDPDKIPRPEIDMQSSYAPKRFVTAEGQAPPASNLNFITIDNGVAGPRFVRASHYSLPPESSILNTMGAPFGIILQPLAEPTQDEEQVAIIDYSAQGPFRCSRCKAYINPHFQWSDGGRIAICNICKMQNKVPSDYYTGIDEFGVRRDKLERHELCKGVYEFLAPADYHNRKPVYPSIVICIDVSVASVTHGIFNQVLSSLESLLDYIPSPELTSIAIFTFDQTITYFQIPEDLTKELKVVAVSDIDDYCVPFPPQTLFSNLAEQKDRLIYLIQKLQKYYESIFQSQQPKTFSTGTCFGAAVSNCGQMLKTQGGRALIFTTSGPTIGMGKLKRRDDYKLYGTDKEKTLYVPQVDEYEQYAKTFLDTRVAIDLFVFSPEYFDFATIGVVSNLTGGNIYYYPHYNANFDGEKLHYDIARNLTRFCGYDAVMNVRASTGISFAEYITPIGRRPQPILELSALDSDYSINVLLKIDEKLTDETVHIQTAILYTNPYGQRVIRVINLALKVSTDLMTNFKGLDVEAVGLLLLRKNLFTISNQMIKQVRESLINQLVNILYSYRFNCANQSSAAQLILPEALKVIPCYYLAALKAHILRTTSDVKPDERSYDLHRFTRLPVNVMSTILYPKLYAIHPIYQVDELGPGKTTEEGRVVLMNNLATTQDKIDDDGIYLIDTAETIYVYVKKDANPTLLENLFGYDNIENIAAEIIGLPMLETDYNVRVNNIIEQLRRNKNSSYQNVRVVVEGDPFEPYLLHNYLVEDDSKYGESLPDFLINIHKLIQQKYN